MSHGKVPVGPKHYTPEQGALLILLPLPQSNNSFSKKTVHTYQPTSPWPMACSLPRLGYWFVEECRCQSPRLFPRLLPKFLHPSDPIHRAMWLQGPQRMVGNRNELNKCPSCVQRFAFPSGAILLLWGTAYRRRSASAQSIITRARPLDCTTQFSCNNATVMSG